MKAEAARLVAYTGSAATAIVLWGAEKLGAELSPEFVTGVAAFAVIVMTEAIRHFVYSTETLEEAGVREVVDEHVEEPEDGGAA